MKEKIKQILARKTWRPLENAQGLVPAAVLIPLYRKKGLMHLLFTKRTNTVRHHKGQISFPGGASASQDESLVDTALRETFEEVGIKPEDVEVLGRLDQSRTITDFVITPFVAYIPYPYPFVTNPREVEELVEVPLSFLLDDSNISFGPVEFDGVKLFDEQFKYNGHIIWGATFRILQQLRRDLNEVFRNREDLGSQAD